MVRCLGNEFLPGNYNLLIEAIYYHLSRGTVNRTAVRSRSK